MTTPDEIKRAMDKLGICRDLLTFDPATGETFDEMFLNQENRDLYDAIGLVIDYVRQLEREREAMLRQLSMHCEACKYWEAPMSCKECSTCTNPWKVNPKENWEWRGVEEEKHAED